MPCDINKVLAQLWQMCLMSLFVLSCKEESFIVVEIPDVIELGHDGGEVAYSLMTNSTWRVDSSEEWCKVTPSNGFGSSYQQEIIIECERNDSYDPRRCSLTFVAGESVASVIVDQECGPLFSVSPTLLEVSPDAQELSVVVTSTESFIYEIEKDAASWLSVVKTRTVESESIIISVSENDTFSSRTGKIQFVQMESGNSVTVSIRQEQNNYLSVSPRQLELSRDAQSIELDIVSNVDWDLVIPQEYKDWIKVDTITLTNAVTINKAIVTVSENKMFNDRSGSLYIIQSDGFLRDTVSLVQRSNAFISVSSTDKELSNKKQTIEVLVETNTDYEVFTEVDWIAYNKSKSSYPDKLAFTVSTNDGYMARSGSVILREVGGDRVEQFTIRQQPAAYMRLATSRIEAGNEVEQVGLDLTTNVSYEVVIPDSARDWISVVSAPQVSEYSDVRVTVQIGRNGLCLDRTASFDIKQKDGGLSEKVTITQSQRELNPGSEYIAVFGDIQYYSNSSHIHLFSKSLDWISHQVDNGSVINCILHTGDITNNNNLNEEWAYFSKAIRGIYEKVPFYSVIGNHDYVRKEGGRIYDREETYFSWFLKLPNTVVVDWFEPGRMENVVIANWINGQRYDILCLEFGPRAEVVAWANEYVSSHPDIKFILVNHEYLENGGGRRTSGLMCTTLKNTTYKKPDDLWDELIKCNDIIVCVLCGHIGSFYTLSFDENDYGRQVPQIQHNIQGPDYRYDNWLMLWEFPSKNDSASVSIVNTKTGMYYSNKEVLFKFRYRY